jgi:folylpolyglutamate synthase/dihydropteroate synthase
VPAAVGIQKSEALKVIRAAADGNNAPVFYFRDLVKYKIRERDSGGSLWDAIVRNGSRKLVLKDVRLAQTGDAFVENFLLAVLSCSLAGVVPEDDSIRKAAELEIPFRIQQEGKWVIDVAHNDSSFENLFETIEKYLKWKKIHLYVGLLSDKEIDKIAAMIRRYRKLIKTLTCFDFKSSRSGGGRLLYDALPEIKNREYQSDISGLDPNPEDYSVFAGSFYIVGPVQNLSNLFNMDKVLLK